MLKKYEQRVFVFKAMAVILINRGTVRKKNYIHIYIYIHTNVSRLRLRM